MASANSGTQSVTERTFLSESGVMVTNARLVARNQTYAISGITSVKSVTESSSATFPVICLVAGIVLVFIAFSNRSLQMGAIGAFLFGLGVVIVKIQKPTYHVVLTSASGEVKAISSQDYQFISKVLAAINSAIISRSS